MPPKTAPKKVAPTAPKKVVKKQPPKASEHGLHVGRRGNRVYINGVRYRHPGWRPGNSD